MLLRIVLVGCLVMLSTQAQARTPGGNPPSVSRVTDAVPASYSAMTTTSTVLSQYVKGLLALRGGQKHVTQEYVERLAREAKEVISEPGNEWMPVHILLGVAMMETDLRWWLKRGYGTVADCGLTQINLTSIYMSTYKKHLLCRALTKRKTGTKLSMQWTMKEMNKIKARYCNSMWLPRIKRYHGAWTWRGKLTAEQQFWRCTLAVYNQGPKFVTHKWNTCTFKHRNIEDPSQAYLDKQAAKCRSRNRYWLSTLCFAEGIRLGKAPRYERKKWTRTGWKVVGHKRASCRYAHSMDWIAARYK